MSPALLVFAALVGAAALGPAAGYPCSPAHRGDCAKPPGGLPPQEVPQFITITWDDGVNSQSYDIIQQIVGGLKQRNGCGVPSTFFTTCTDTEPSALQALYLAGNEIASHTMTHQGYPSREEIVGCRDWLVQHTGIPRSKLSGFRAPFLLADASTRKALADDGFLYDSSISDTAPSKVSRSVKQRTWPYSMEDGIPQSCDTGKCSSKERYPLWEIPLWATADAKGRPISSMDPPGDALQIYTKELERRLAGNRAPLGLFFHAGLESQPERVAQLRKFIKHAKAQKDVWFVTNQALLAWMQDPVPASQVGPSLLCSPPTDISPSVGKVCSTYVSNCQYGSWDSKRCRCRCMGEGRRGGYCRDHSTGACTRLC